MKGISHRDWGSIQTAGRSGSDLIILGSSDYVRFFQSSVNAHIWILFKLDLGRFHSAPESDPDLKQNIRPEQKKSK